MKKDYIRDYATEAFRFYATIGMTSDEYRNKIAQEAIENMSKKEVSISSSGPGRPTESQLLYSEKLVEEKLSAIYDIDAVEKTLKECETTYLGREIKKVIEIVYFTEAKQPIRKGDIRDRVLKVCDELHISESTAYRHLKKARLLFAHNRGLRVEEYYR